MKRPFLTLSTPRLAGTSLVPIAMALIAANLAAFGQGTVGFVNTSYTLVRTNSIGIGGTAGNSSPNPNGFFYGLFIAPSTVSSLSPLDLLTPTWTFSGVYATNTIASTGGRLSGGTYVLVPAWDATTNSYAVVGWSANIAGSDWSTVAAQLSGASFNNGVWSGPNWQPSSDRGFFGVSSVGFGVAPDVIEGKPQFPLFNSGPNPQGNPISTGFDLFVVNVPEPSTFALGIVGTLAILALRRRGANCKLKLN